MINLKKILFVVVNCIALVISMGYLYLKRDQLMVLQNASCVEILLLMTTTLLYFFVTGYTFKLLVGLLQIPLTMQETLGLSVITNFGNYLGPTSPGSALKAVYLKSRKGFEYTKFVSVFGANNFFGFFMMGVMGTVLYVWLKKIYPQAPVVLLFYSLALVIGCGLPIFLKIPSLKQKGRIAEIWQAVIEGYNDLFKQPQACWAIAVSYAMQFFVRAGIFWLAFQALHMPIPFVLSLAAAVYTSMFDFYLTPNNLGIQEALGAYVLTFSSIEFSHAVMGLLLVRVVHLVTTLVLAPIFIHLLLKDKPACRQAGDTT